MFFLSGLGTVVPPAQSVVSRPVTDPMVELRDARKAAAIQAQLALAALRRAVYRPDASKMDLAADGVAAAQKLRESWAAMGKDTGPVYAALSAYCEASRVVAAEYQGPLFLMLNARLRLLAGGYQILTPKNWYTLRPYVRGVGVPKLKQKALYARVPTFD